MSESLTKLSPEQLIVVRARMESGDYRRDDVTALFGHLEALQQDAAETDELNDKMAGILRDTAAALKGRPEPLSSHSWHNLAEMAGQWKARAEEAECFTKILPCVELDEPSFDFKSCVTHDRTFALDGSCDYAGKSVVTYLEDAVSNQRFRAITAEDPAAAAEAASSHSETSTP